jgi:hypothetical protein
VANASARPSENAAKTGIVDRGELGQLGPERALELGGVRVVVLVLEEYAVGCYEPDESHGVVDQLVQPAQDGEQRADGAAADAGLGPKPEHAGAVEELLLVRRSRKTEPPSHVAMADEVGEGAPNHHSGGGVQHPVGPALVLVEVHERLDLVPQHGIPVGFRGGPPRCRHVEVDLEAGRLGIRLAGGA